ncbi:hypothetical protein GCM10017687_10250 [Streptomyces echinatus]
MRPRDTCAEGGCGAVGEYELVGAAGQGQDALGHVESSSGAADGDGVRRAGPVPARLAGGALEGGGGPAAGDSTHPPGEEEAGVGAPSGG